MLSTRRKTPRWRSALSACTAACFLAAVLTACGPGGTAAPGAPEPRPSAAPAAPGKPFDSLLLVTIDTLRADHVSCYGLSSPVRTPILDGLAARGALVRRAWATVPLTTASHTSIMSGLYPPTNGVRLNSRYRIPDSVVMLAERLAQAGRTTGAFVASFTTSRMFGFDQGFATFDDDMGHDADGARRQQRPGNEVVDAASRWLDAHGAGRFFLWVHLFDPHSPYEPPADLMREHPGDPYSGEVAFADAQLGRLLGALERTGASNRTAIIVLADHGEGLGDHGELDHGYLLYESTLSIPMILVGPGRIRPGSTIEGPASTVDVVPTALDLLGLPAAAGVQGRSLIGSEPPMDRPLYAETLYPRDEFGWSSLYATRRGDLKMIDAPSRELYDVAADRSETSDLAASRTSDVAALSTRLQDLMKSLGEAGAAARSQASQPDVDPETLAKLESLGYVGGGAAAGTGEEAFPPVGGRNPRAMMGLLKRLWQAQVLLLDRKPAEAIPILRAIGAEDPENPKIQLKLAEALADSGHPEEAAGIYETLIRRQPPSYLVYRAYSEFLEARKQPAKVIELWQRAPTEMRAIAGVVVITARAETATGKPDRAASLLDIHLASNPQDAEAWAELGAAEEARGNRTKALDAYRRALALRPTEMVAIQGAVNLLVETGRRPEANALVQELLRKAPGDPFLLKAQDWLNQPGKGARPSSGG